jgi:hypothetical protein
MALLRIATKYSKPLIAVWAWAVELNTWANKDASVAITLMVAAPASLPDDKCLKKFKTSGDLKMILQPNAEVPFGETPPATWIIDGYRACLYTPGQFELKTPGMLIPSHE